MSQLKRKTPDAISAPPKPPFPPSHLPTLKHLEHLEHLYFNFYLSLLLVIVPLLFDMKIFNKLRVRSRELKVENVEPELLVRKAL